MHVCAGARVLSGLATLVAVLVFALLVRVLRLMLPDSEPVWRSLQTKRATVGVMLFSGIALSLTAGTLHRMPVVPDEWLYATQAALFAHLRWTGGPVPAVFDSAVAFAAVASKYPPGESLLLTPGVWLHVPSVMPVVLTAVTAGGIFAIARRIADVRVATLTVLYWLSLPQTLIWHVSYMSEVASGATWLIAWWCLLTWVRDGTRAALIGVGVAIGVAAITRPLSAIALSVPVAIVVIAVSARRRAWWLLGRALLAGCAVLSVIPVWNAKTTGSWRMTPIEAARREYMPFDKLGFGFDSTPPRRLFPPDLDRAMQSYRDGHRGYTPAAVPAALVSRLRFVARDVWAGPRRGLFPFFILSAAVITFDAWIGVASTALLIALYLLYWTPPSWTIYYLEVEPVLCFLTVVGCVRFVEWTAGRMALRRLPLALAVVASVAVVVVLWVASDARKQTRASAAYYWRFDSTLASLPASKALVFVRYSPTHLRFNWLTRNELDLSAARIWLLNDIGPRDIQLQRLAPDRRAYIFDEATWTLTPLPTATCGRPVPSSALTDTAVTSESETATRCRLAPALADSAAGH